MKKAGTNPTKKAGAPAKKAGLVVKKAGLNTAPRDFLVAQRALHNLIDDYAGISPLTVVPKNPTLRDEIIQSIATSDMEKLRFLHNKNTAKFMQEAHKPGGKDACLVFSASRGNESALRFLLDLGVDPNQTDESGQTAVHTASGGGYITILSLLLRRGACVWLNDISGNSPFLLAAARGFEEVLLELVEFGANPWVRDVTEREEIDYIFDAEIRAKVAKKAYWVRRRFFIFTLRRPPFSRLSFNLNQLISLYF